MALITETGTAGATSESYASVADADAFHADRGNTLWATITTAEKEQALRRSTDYMMQKYRTRWKGYRYSGTQALDFPRTFVYLEPFVHGIVGTYPFLLADNIVPVELVRACCSLAVRAAAGMLLADQQRAKIRTKIGPLETEYERYSVKATQYPEIDAMLAPYLLSAGGGAMVGLTRA